MAVNDNRKPGNRQPLERALVLINSQLLVDEHKAAIGDHTTTLDHILVSRSQGGIIALLCKPPQSAEHVYPTHGPSNPCILVFLSVDMDAFVHV